MNGVKKRMHIETEAVMTLDYMRHIFKEKALKLFLKNMTQQCGIHLMQE